MFTTRTGTLNGVGGQHCCEGASRRYRSPEKGGSQSIGKSRGGWTTKIHMVAADDRTAVAFRLSPGQAHDAPQGRRLLQSLGAQSQKTRFGDGPRLRRRRNPPVGPGPGLHPGGSSQNHSSRPLGIRSGGVQDPQPDQAAVPTAERLPKDLLPLLTNSTSCSSPSSPSPSSTTPYEA